jgi:DNA-binding NtrC family response regulator
MNRQARVLVVEDEECWREDTFRYELEKQGYAVYTAASCDEAMALLEEEPFDLAVIDINLTDVPGNTNGLLILDKIKERGQRVQSVLVSGSPTILQRPEKLEELGKTYAPSAIIRKDSFDIREFVKIVKGAMAECLE